MRSERKVRFHRINELETNPEWNRAAVLKTADFTNTIAEIDLEPICAIVLLITGTPRRKFSVLQVNLNFNTEFNSE